VSTRAVVTSVAGFDCLPGIECAAIDQGGACVIAGSRSVTRIADFVGAFERGELPFAPRLSLKAKGLTELPSLAPYYDMKWAASASSLDITQNPFQSFPSPAVLSLRGLVTLRAEQCGLKEFPIELVQLRHLTELDLSQNAIASLPESIVELQELPLKLGSNRLVSLPESLGALRSLTVLSL
jgi:Leucine-rich repeat (LRR) protein